MQIVVICCKFPLIYSSSFYELFYFRPLAFCTALLFTELTGDFFLSSAALLFFSFFISVRLSHDDTATSRARANWEQSTATNRSERRRHRSRIDNEILSSYKQITVPISLQYIMHHINNIKGASLIKCMSEIHNFSSLASRTLLLGREKCCARWTIEGKKKLSQKAQQKRLNNLSIINSSNNTPIERRENNFFPFNYYNIFTYAHGIRASETRFTWFCTMTTTSQPDLFKMQQETHSANRSINNEWKDKREKR